MGNLTPIAFDIETSGLDEDAIITVVGFAHGVGEKLILNTAGRPANSTELEHALREHSAGSVDLTVTPDEQTLLTALKTFADSHLDDDRHYLTAYHGETWNGGFDLPFLRTACVKHNAEWPFPNLAYADMLDVINRFNTNETTDLVGVYDQLIGKDSCDAFEDSESAVDTFDNGEWEQLLLHNLADIQRPQELTALAGRYVPQSDFRMKNLSPPTQ